MTSKCPYCAKEYSRKSSLDKHVLLCDFLQKSKKEKNLDIQETDNLPSYKELVMIVQELAVKNKKLEEKLVHFEKWVETKKKKINVKQWLNQHVIPQTTFAVWCQQIQVTQQHLHYLFESTIHETVNRIMNDQRVANPEVVLPIYAFDQKNNVFYICAENGESQTREWTEMTNTNFSTILIKIQQRLLQEMDKWRTQNIQQINSNEKMTDVYNKTIMKLMNINSTQDGTMSKIKSNFYQSLKVDLKNLIEYEFEF
jgi:hypothetical protein